MSVVNKMLKDLEQRDKQSIYEADYVPVESQSAKSRKLVVGILVLSSGVALATWLLLPKTNASLKSESQIVASAQPSNLVVLSKNPDAKHSAPENNVPGIAASEDMRDELPQQAAQKVVLSELDEATLVSLESAKQADAEAATKAAEATLAQLNREIAQARQEQSKQVEPQTASLDNRNASHNSTSASSDNNTRDNGSDNNAAQAGVFSVSSSNKSASGKSMLEQRIQLSLKNGDTPAALKDLNSLVALEPRNSSARKRLASLEFAQGNPKRAAFLLDQGIKLAPADSSLRLMQARLLFRENRNEQALRLLNEHPDNVIADNDLLSFRAALAEKQKEYTTSLQDYAVLLQRQPSNARWMLGLAISQDKQKMHDEAVITYKKVKSSNQLSTQVVSFVDGRLAALVGS